MPKHKYHNRACEDCGADVFTGANGGYAVLCKPCAAERRRIYKLGYNERKRMEHGRKPIGFRIISDPDDIAGFPRDAVITREESDQMLRMCSYTVGTLIRGWRGKLYQIVKAGNVQKMVVMDGEAG